MNYCCTVLVFVVFSSPMYFGPYLGMFASCALCSLELGFWLFSGIKIESWSLLSFFWYDFGIYNFEVNLISFVGVCVSARVIGEIHEIDLDNLVYQRIEKI